MRIPAARGLLAILIGGVITAAMVGGIPTIGSTAPGDDLEVTPLGVVYDVFSSPCVIDDQMLFVANGNDELWVTDGTIDNTSMIKALDGYTNLGCAVLDERLYFTVSETDLFNDKTQLWVTDGTTDGTRMLADLGPDHRIGVSAFGGLWVAVGRVFFLVSGPVTGTELWVTDGTDGGSRLATALSPANDVTRIEQVTTFGDRAAFVVNGDLWVSDGTPAGTGLAPGFGFAHGLAEPDNLTAFGDRVLFNTDTGIWMNNGHTSTVLLTATARLGSGRMIGGRLVFRSWTSARGFELWVTDGTVSGTQLLADVRATDIEQLGEQLVFGTTPTALGIGELWVTDGTPAGTRMITQIESGSPRELKVIGDHVIFGVFECCVDPGEVWVSDLTPSGTHRLRQIYPALKPRVFGAQYPIFSFGFTQLGNRAVFGAVERQASSDRVVLVNGGVWVTDGTPEGTGLVAEVGGLAEFRAVGDNVIFIAGARDTHLGEEQFYAVARDHDAAVEVADYHNAPNLASLINADNYSTKFDAPVLRLYQAYFNRDPDLAGAKYWLDVRRMGYNTLNIAGFMAGSNEFANTYAGTSNAEFVQRVYQNVLGRFYDQAGYDYWLDLLDTGKLDRAGTVYWTTQGQEFINKHPYTPTN